MDVQKTFDEMVVSWGGFLKENPLNYIRIKNLEYNSWLQFEKSQQPSYLHHDDVLQKAQTFGHFLDQLITANNLKDALITFRRKRGQASSPVKNMNSVRVDFSNRLEQLQSKGTSVQAKTPERVSSAQTEPPAQPLAPVTPPTQHQNNFGMEHNYQQNVMQHMGGLGAAGLAAGLGYRQLIDLEKKAEQSDFYKREMDELKKRNAELEIDNRKLQSDVSVAEKEKELAIRSTELDSKSWTDPETLKTVLESIAPVATQFLASKSGAPQVGMGASQGLSEIKQRFWGYLSDPEFEDDKVRVLESTLAVMLQRPEFQLTLTNLINSEAQKDVAAGS